MGDNPSVIQSTSTPINSANPQRLFDPPISPIPIYESHVSANSRHLVNRGRVRKARINRVDREIKRLQNTIPVDSLVQTHGTLAPFSRLVRETITKMSGGKTFRVQSEAIEALMQASEAYLVTLFQTSYWCTNHAKRVTLSVEDIQLVRRILAAFGM
uniref:Histone H2A/H2B/H3 domain-containing protein n=1 Tax=Panagrolaimus davidi TaxID=227884 RepID=A0A914Q0R5_9BILA